MFVLMGKQRVCCGPIPHFDLSFWAAELAHPVRGKRCFAFGGGLRDARTGGRAARRGRAHAHASTRVARRCVNERRRKRPTRRLVPRRSSGRRWTPRDCRVRKRTLCRMELERVQRRKDETLEPRSRRERYQRACFRGESRRRLAMHCIGCEATAKPFVSARDSVLIRSPDCERDPRRRTPRVSRHAATRSVRDYETGTTPGETACG